MQQQPMMQTYGAQVAQPQPAYGAPVMFSAPAMGMQMPMMQGTGRGRGRFNGGGGGGGRQQNNNSGLTQAVSGLTDLMTSQLQRQEAAEQQRIALEKQREEKEERAAMHASYEASMKSAVEGMKQENAGILARLDKMITPRGSRQAPATYEDYGDLQDDDDTGFTPRPRRRILGQSSSSSRNSGGGSSSGTRSSDPSSRKRLLEELFADDQPPARAPQRRQARGPTPEQLSACLQRKLSRTQLEQIKLDLDTEFDNGILPRNPSVLDLTRVCDQDQTGDLDEWRGTYRNCFSAPPNHSFSKREIILRICYKSLAEM